MANVIIPNPAVFDLTALEAQLVEINKSIAVLTKAIGLYEGKLTVQSVMQSKRLLQANPDIKKEVDALVTADPKKYRSMQPLTSLLKKTVATVEDLSKKVGTAKTQLTAFKAYKDKEIQDRSILVTKRNNLIMAKDAEIQAKTILIQEKETALQEKEAELISIKASGEVGVKKDG
jgi:hypothetical protein